ncbi:hypothetical protein F5X68DRAFT_4256 [Plectosphaerella plurivora]|uniref:Uncharacterized protein n=1 Tax=Plectosphaerella plurivora TaxID=936078 RepID=A0A9P9AGL2_9PEZI|nr:hypothetical protein F5X68DRAFT_4256 [Plectosphaerella plurivora]
MLTPPMNFPGVGRDVVRTLSKVASLRTVLIKVRPAPVKLSERRAVLNALQQIVKVEVFRKTTPSSFVSVLKSQDDMKRLIDRSPLEFSMVTEKPSTGVISFLTSAPSTNAVIENKAESPDKKPDDVSASQARKAAADDKTERRRFTVDIWHKQAYVHASAIRASPLHGPWPPAGKMELESFLKADMPDNIATRGLSDWETGGQVPDAENAKKLEDVLFGHVAVDVVKRAVQDRRKRKKMKENRPPVMDGLLHMRRDSNRKIIEPPEDPTA